MKIVWNEISWNDYTYWQTQDKRTLKRINQLIKDKQRNGTIQGIGKPEPLRYQPGYSRHIDDTNRLVYDIKNDELVILSCRGHYED